MYKQSGLLVIAALVIASMGILAPTTTVTAVVPVPDVAATAPTVVLTPTSVRDNAYVVFTLTVTNPSDSDNIENILIQDVSTAYSTNFADAIFGENVRENLENVGENLKWVGTELAFVAENLRRAKTAITAAADALQTATNNLDNAGSKFADSGRENLVDFGSRLQTADDYLQKIVTALKTEPIDWANVGDNMRQAAETLHLAGWNLSQDGYEVLREIGENFDNFAENLDNIIADLLAAPYLSEAAWGDGHGGTGAQGLYENAEWAENAYITFRDNYDNTSTATVQQGGEYLDNFAFHLRQFAENLGQAAENIRAAGSRLENIAQGATEWDNVSGLPSADNIAALYYLDEDGDEDVSELDMLDAAFIENIRLAAENLNEDNDSLHENIGYAGELLIEATKWQDQWLGTDLASNLIGYDGEVTKTSARYWISVAGACLVRADNTAENDNMDLTAAASAIDNAAAQFTAAGTKIKETAANISPTTKWGAVNVSNGLLISALDYENDYIAPGESTNTFKFLWKAPDVSDIVENHTIRVWTLSATGSIPENSALSATDFTVSVDGEIPTVVIKVTQENVKDYLGTAVDNLIGTVYGDATITVTVSKETSSFGTMRVENYKHLDDNLVLTIGSFTTTDNKVFTYAFSPTGWDENLENTRWEDGGTGGPRVFIEAPCATTATGIENDQSVSCYFEVDLFQPAFQERNADEDDNGLTQFLDLTPVWKPGTDENEYHLTSVKRWTISGRAEDNDNVNLTTGTTDNAKWAMTTVTLNGTALTMTRLADDNFSVTENLAEGVNSIVVTVTDRVGLTVENRIENVFVDNTPPVVTSVSVAGSTWTDNTLKVKDNKPTIRLKIQDTGWGIPWDNLRVVLDNDTDLNNGEIENWLENNGTWDNGVAAGVDYNFENTYDNDNKGLEGGTYYITVLLSDNVLGHDNDNWVQAFIVDVSLPSAPASVAASVSAGSSAATAVTIKATSMTVTGTAEAESTVKVYKSLDSGATWTVDTSTAATATAAADGTWTVTVSVTEGTVTGIKITCVDTAGNESTATTLGYVKADLTKPTVTITSPTTGFSTEDASIAVAGTVSKDSWETWSNLTLTIQVGTSAVTVPLTGTTFSTSVDLSLGTSTIIATVDDGVNDPVAASVNVTRTAAAAAPSPQATEYASYAIILVIVALILAAIAIFRKK